MVFMNNNRLTHTNNKARNAHNAHIVECVKHDEQPVAAFLVSKTDLEDYIARSLSDEQWATIVKNLERSDYIWEEVMALACSLAADTEA